MKDKASWEEALRLLHKFCPQSKNHVKKRSDFSLGKIDSFIYQLEVQFSEQNYDTGLESIEIFKTYYGNFLEFESGRVLVVPDLNWDEKSPFVCSVKKLLERIDEGIILERDKGNSTNRPWELIDEGSDVLFVFETTGSVLFFDHHQNCVLAKPY